MLLGQMHITDCGKAPYTLLCAAQGASDWEILAEESAYLRPDVRDGSICRGSSMNGSDIQSRLIAEAGRFAERYASDVVATLEELNPFLAGEFIPDGKPHDYIIGAGIRRAGVDHNTFIMGRLKRSREHGSPFVCTGSVYRKLLAVWIHDEPERNGGLTVKRRIAICDLTNAVTRIDARDEQTEGGGAGPESASQAGARYMLAKGKVFNAAVKSLAAGKAVTWAEQDQSIDAIRLTLDAPGDGVKTANVAAGGSAPILAYFEGWTIYLYAGGQDRIELNEDSSRMFSWCTGLTTISLPGIDTSKVKNMAGMFAYCRSLKSPCLQGWDTGNVADMHEMFSGCDSLKSANAGGWDTSLVADMRSMFAGCVSLESLDVSGWDTGSVTDMGSMFAGCRSLESLDVSGWKTGKVEGMNSMFEGCASLESLDVSAWDTGSVTGLDGMFCGCASLLGIDVSRWDTSHVKLMGAMFKGCQRLAAVNVQQWDTSNARIMWGMFYGCQRLSILDLSGWDTSGVTIMHHMFCGCTRLETIYASGLWNTGNVEHSAGMFAGCISLKGGAGTAYSLTHAGRDYARIDGGADSPGYFTRN